MNARDALEVVRKGIIGLYDQQAMPDDSAQPKLDEALAVLTNLVERYAALMKIDEAMVERFARGYFGDRYTSEVAQLLLPTLRKAWRDGLTSALTGASHDR